MTPNDLLTLLLTLLPTEKLAQISAATAQHILNIGPETYGQRRSRLVGDLAAMPWAQTHLERRLGVLGKNYPMQKLVDLSASSGHLLRACFRACGDRTRLEAELVKELGMQLPAICALYGDPARVHLVLTDALEMVMCLPA